MADLATSDDILAQQWFHGLRQLRLIFNAHLLISMVRRHVFTWFWILAFSLLAWRIGWAWQVLAGFFSGLSLIWGGWLGYRFHNLAYAKSEIIEVVDIALELHHAIHCANKGLSPWPNLEVLQRVQAHYKMDYQKALWSPSFGLMLLVMVLWIPLSKDVQTPLVGANPWALQEIETWLEELQKEPNFDPETLRAWANTLNALKNESETASQQEAAAQREATDRLQEEMTASIAEAQNTLTSMESQVSKMMAEQNKLQSFAGQQASTPAKASSERLSQLMEKARQMQLSWSDGATKALSSAMSNKSAQSIQGLEELPELKSSLQRSLAMCKKCLGSQAGSESGEGPGNGGVNQGPGEAPLQFGAPQEALVLETLESLPESERLQLGDKFETLQHEPETNTEVWTTGKDGHKVLRSAESTGVIWKQRIRPEEKKVLYRMKP